MSDFETMPIGTRAAIKEAAELFRSYERHHLDIANRTGARTGRREKAQRNADAAAKLEALLAQPGVEMVAGQIEELQRLARQDWAQPCANHEYIEPACPDCGKLACAHCLGMEGAHTSKCPLAAPIGGEVLPLEAC